MVYGEGAIAERFRSDSPPLSLNERNRQNGSEDEDGCSVFGPGIGASVY